MPRKARIELGDVKIIAVLAILLLAALCFSAKAGDIRSYQGPMYGSVQGVVVTATVEIEVDGTPAAGSECLARARLLSDPGVYPVSKAWSRWQRATIGGKPARFEIVATALTGSLGVDWSDDFSNITVQARGKASIFDVVIEPSMLALTKHSAAQSNAPVVVKPNAILTRVYAKKKGMIGFDANVPSSWPKASSKNGKTVNAIACINGRKFDWVRVGQHEKGVENLYGEKYGQRIVTGQTVEFSLKDINSRNETPRLPFVWPWEPTGR